MEYEKMLFILLFIRLTSCALVINTWRFEDAAREAWNYVQNGYNSIDALEAGCKVCETMQCDYTVGYGGSPDESGETTLDAMIFDGKTMDMGAVGALRRIKSAISVAKHVLHNTQHSFLVGDQATAFAIEMGFKDESLSTNFSKSVWQEWKNRNCQPNSWKNVEPDPTETCGPYQPLSENSILYHFLHKNTDSIQRGHDTIGMVVLDKNNDIAAGTSTNGLRHKIPGRVGDSPIPGAGAYADNDVGAASATGDGDVMMRFLPSFLAVEQMRRDRTPTDAARIAITRITDKYPNFSGAVVAVNMKGQYGAACNLMAEFPFSVANDATNAVTVETVPCSNPPA